ncbi:AAA family ATPase [Bradyrhizobium sp. HKCCYLS2058]|uniref:ATP-binding protein n=1 Tax=unclassified Bradyrhizobium TaxID=2631580 RepID=UPI003EB868B8
MRIRRLDLLRYGHFTDAALHMPPGQPDLHFVVGPNEAGKSTALSAIEDLLFGIPHNSTRNFTHDYNTMRIGALLETEGGQLDIRRRKGNRDTIIDGNGVPFPAGESGLASFLAGADRAFFVRMFCLDHERLRTGGQEILQAQDDVGQMLFSAGAGISGLRQRLKALEEEADTLWASRRAGHRKFYQADEKLKAAEAALREHTFAATKWQDLKTAVEEADAAIAKLEADIESKAAEHRKLTRVRRVCRDVRKRAEIDAAIQQLGETVSLPQDAAVILADAIRDQNIAATRIDTLNEEIAKLERERSLLVYDENFLIRGEDIARLHERRITIRDRRSDLPKRRAELAVAESQLAGLAAEIGWTPGDAAAIVARIPTRTALASIRSLLNQRGEMDSAVASAEETAQEAENKAAELVQTLADAPAVPDVSTLGAVIKTCREAGDIAARIAAAERDAKEASAASERLLKSIWPKATSLADLAALAPPSKDAIQAHRDAVRDHERRTQACLERIRAAEQECLRHDKAYARIAKTENAVSLEGLRSLRERRDLGWSIIRRKHLDNAPVGDDEIEAFQGRGTLPDAYEGAVRDVDDAADRRFDNAQAAARLAEIGRQRAEQQELLDALKAENGALTAEQQRLDGAWTTLWANTGIAPAAPDEMLAWLDLRAQAIDCAGKIEAAERNADSLRTEEDASKSLLAKELTPLGVDPSQISSKPLRVVIEFAADAHKRFEKQDETRKALEDSLKSANAEAARKKAALAAAQTRRSEWQDKSAAALASLGVDQSVPHETLLVQLGILDEMREIAARITDLRQERIEKIERDITAFEEEVAELVKAIAADLAATAADDAILELHRRSGEAIKIRDEIAAKDKALTEQQQKVEECRKSGAGAQKAIVSLQAAAAVTSLDDLKDAIKRSDTMRALRGDMDSVTSTLSSDGDGLTVAELETECAGADPDHLAAREATAGEELQALRDQLVDMRQTQRDARKNFDAVGGADGAARAAVDRQSALAEMSEIAERYVRLRSAGIVLRHAIDRYRREKQAPLLKRAGQLFSTLTGQSFTELQLELDQHDNAHLAGIRRGGGSVPVSGMSTGTADQLYLALRLAAVEDYLGHARPLPFVADDLFINFDDDRSRAGFQVLGEIAKKTQVLFFTHHKHLIDVAREALGDGMSVTELDGPAVAYQAPLAIAAAE